MALRYGFFNSIDGDRRYDALDMSSIFDGIIEDGVFATIGNIFAVTPGEGLQVVVDTGKAWFDHTWTSNDAPIPLGLDTPDITLARYDAVVLEVNNEQNVRANSIKIVKGTAASDPQKPELLQTGTVKQHVLAYVKVLPGSTSVAANNIEIQVGKDSCPFVTGPLETVPIDTLFARWESEFDDWFEHIKSSLEGDVALNLQKQIDERVKIADKATEPDIETGTDDEKWMSPMMTGKMISHLLPAETSVGNIAFRPDKAPVLSDDFYLACDGSLHDSTKYPKLFSEIGTNYGFEITSENLVRYGRRPTRSMSAVDPITGVVYVVTYDGGSASPIVKWYDRNNPSPKGSYTLLNSNASPDRMYEWVIRAYDDVVSVGVSISAAGDGDELDRAIVAVSTDGGATWTRKIDKGSGAAIPAYNILMTRTQVVFFMKPYNDRYKCYVFDKSSKKFSTQTISGIILASSYLNEDTAYYVMANGIYTWPSKGMYMRYNYGDSGYARTGYIGVFGAELIFIANKKLYHVVNKQQTGHDIPNLKGTIELDRDYCPGVMGVAENGSLRFVLIRGSATNENSGDSAESVYALIDSENKTVFWGKPFKRTHYGSVGAISGIAIIDTLYDDDSSIGTRSIAEKPKFAVPDIDVAGLTAYIRHS